MANNETTKQATIREATIDDIPQMHAVRVSVTENVLSDQSLVTIAHYNDYLTKRGKGWVCDEAGLIVGFAIADSIENNIWALFVRPDYERKGIGKQLHDKMLNWHFSQSDNKLWLSTEPGTRAENFYKKAGWEYVGLYGNNEIKFEINADFWRKSE